eukprot:11367628-Ditylum_brightwellii.AAC.1
MHWINVCTVQRNNTPKGIPTEIMFGTVTSLAGAPPHNFVGKPCGSGAPLLGQNATCFIFIPRP